MPHLRSNRRPAFTLLEMMLALVIGVLLMSALYMALDMHMTGANAGRVQIDQAQVARFVVKNITADVNSQIAMLDAYPPPTSTSKTAAAATTTTGTYVFNYGVKGDSERLELYVSKVPKSAGLATDPNGAAGVGSDMPADESDLRRVVYWLIPNGDGHGGLARQEVKWVTSDDQLGNEPPDVADEQTMVFAKTVIAVTFEYYDGVQWLSEWDGTEPLNEETTTPRGPPVAIAVTVTVARPDNLNVEANDPSVKTFRHVVQLPTASFHENGMRPSNGGNAP